MFSPMGKKKILLQQKFGGSTGSPPRSPSPNGTRGRSLSPTAQVNADGQNLLELRKKIKILAPTSVIAASSKLESALTDVGVLGVAMRKIMDATARYRSDRDGVLLKAFESKSLDYNFFRLNLQAVFWLTFSDEEYNAVLEYFDPTHAGIIDGYSFMKAFVRLSGIRKDRESLEVREKQERYEQTVKDDAERAVLEKNKRLEKGIDYNFTADIRKVALKKLEDAAAKFDPGHPSAPSTKAFDVNFVKPATFREMLKLTLNLKLDPKELGAVMKEFRADVTTEMPCGEFLKYFLRLGIDARDHQRQEQRKRQEMMDEKVVEEQEKKKQDTAKKLKAHVDYNFTEIDESSANEKLRAVSEKYDKAAPGCVALDGFECEELSPMDFKELVRRVFNLPLTATELGYIIQKYDVKKTGNVFCKTFLIDFLQLGYEARHETHIKQLEKQRKMNEEAEKEHLEKMKSVQKSEKVAYSKNFANEDLQSALKKLTDAAVFFDRERSGGFKSFEVESVDLIQFKRGLKRTFNIDYTANEMGAIWDYLPKNEKLEVICYDFLNIFIGLGAAERDRFRLEQLEKQREANRNMKEEHEKKILEQQSKILYEVEYEFDPEELDSALEKMTIAAKRYDPGHPAALSLQGFDVKSIDGPQFKELVRRTFLLALAPREVGALFKFFSDRTPYGKSKPPFDQIICGDFLIYFLQVGITERAKVHTAQLERQRAEDKEREEEHQRKVLETANRQTYKPDYSYTDADKESIIEKLKIAAEKFDKNHPAAPSLEAFDAAFMMPGVFRENIKSIFGVRATPKEIGYLLELYDKDKSGRITTREFLLKFFSMGKEIRDAKKRESLIKQREALKAAKEEEALKLTQLVEKSDYQIDRNYTSEDHREAIRRMTIASENYDKAHPSAPNLDGFTGGPLSAGAFRELMKRAFQIYLTSKEVASIIDKYHVDNNTEMLDGKKFLIMFMKLGQESRARIRSQQLIEQRKFQNDLIQEEERKLRMAMRRVELEVDSEYTDSDRVNGLSKIVEAAVLYDRNAPGCVSLDSFNSKFFTPGVFRETVKRTFNIILTPGELAAMIAQFDNGSGNVDTQKFLVSFVKMGQEEREKRKLMQLEKQRNMDAIRKKVAEQKKLEADAKNNLKVSYKYTAAEKEAAFYKLGIAAKKFDKAHPAAMSLDGFEEKTLKPHVFREMLKRTFNFVGTAAELGAIIHYFDQNNTGEVSSKKFLIHFVKLGIAERAKEHKESLRKLAEDAVLRERQHEEKMAAQWAKAELNVVFEFTEEEKKSAMEKLTVASSKFDPASPGPMGLTGFQAKVLSPAIFREMLKRCFNLILENGELAALISEFEDKDQFAGKHMINCHDFLIKFNTLGFDKRDEFRLAQLEKQRQLDAAFEEQRKLKIIALETKKDINIEVVVFSDSDFQSALEKIRVLASNYDRSHPSAPSLKGFTGTDMKPNEFKDMLMRTFQMPLSLEELAALVAFFPSSQNAAKSEAAAGSRIDNKEFLNYFNKIQREEQSKRNYERIMRERDAIRKEKEKKQQLVDDEVQDLVKKLKYTPADENTCVEKMKEAAKEYAIDSGPYLDRLQGFKGPALPPDKFRELFYNIFAVRFTFPELGVLLNILDYSNLRVFDGPRFLNFFYKISRVEEKFMLGESDTPVTFETLKEVGKRPSNENVSGELVKTMSKSKTSPGKGIIDSRSSTVNSNVSNLQPATPVTVTRAATSKSKHPKDSSLNHSVFPMVDYTEIVPYDHRQDHTDSHSFNRSTLNQSWLLPSIASLDHNLLDEEFSFYGENFHNMATSKDQDRLATAATKVRDHLRLLFHSDKLDDPQAFSVSSTLGFEDGDSTVSGLDASSFRTPNQVVEAISNLEKMRLSVQTAPSVDQSVGSKSDGKGAKFSKTKSSPFIVVPAQPAMKAARNREDDTITTVSQEPSLDLTYGEIGEKAFDNNCSVDSAVDDTTTVNSPPNKSQSAKVVEGDYLRSLFSSLSTITDGSNYVKKVPSYAKDPISQLVRLQSHFHESPMAAMASKHKESSRKYRTKKLSAVTLAPIEQRKKEIKKNSEQEQKNKKHNEGGFFFPTLLTADSHNDGSDSVFNDEESDIKVPNIDIVGIDSRNTESYDIDFLKQLLLPNEAK